MRQFEFWGTWEDSFAIIAAILDTGKATAFRSKPYAEPQAQFFDRFTPDLREIARERGALYFWLPGISYFPLRFARWESGIYAGQYFVTGGGPFLQLSLPACHEEGGLTRLGCGDLSCDHEFYEPDARIVVKMPKAAQQIDDEFVKIIKARCKRFGPKKRWVGHHARKLLEEGKAEVTSPGYYKSARDLRTTK